MFDQNTSNTMYFCLMKAVLACLLKQCSTKGDLLLSCDTLYDLQNAALVIAKKPKFPLAFETEKLFTLVNHY